MASLNVTRLDSTRLDSATAAARLDSTRLDSGPQGQVESSFGRVGCMAFGTEPETCGGCGQTYVPPIQHRCDLCQVANHAICGDGVEYDSIAITRCKDKTACESRGSSKSVWGSNEASQAKRVQNSNSGLDESEDAEEQCLSKFANVQSCFLPRNPSKEQSWLFVQGYIT